MAKAELRLTLSQGRWPDDTEQVIAASFPSKEVMLRQRPAFSLESVDPAVLQLILDVAKIAVVALPLLRELIKYTIDHFKNATPNTTGSIEIRTGRTSISVPVQATPEQIDATARALATALQDDAKSHGNGL